MITLIALLMIFLVMLGIGIAMLINNSIEKRVVPKTLFNRRIKKFGLLTCISVLLVGLVVFAMIYGAIKPIENASVVANIYGKYRSSTPLYYDEYANEYFVLTTSPFNPINIHQRRVIDNTTAEKYIDIYKQLLSIDIQWLE